MPRTLAEIRSSVLEYGFAPSQYTTPVTRWIDDGQRFIFRRANLRNKETDYSFNTVVNQISYELPTNFAAVTYLFNETEDTTLSSIPKSKEFLNLETSTSEPGSYLIDQTSIKLYPTPDKVYSMVLRYKKIPSSIVSESSSSPTIQEDYYQLLEEYALFKAYAKENDREESEFHKRLFDEGLVEFTDQMDHATDDSPRQVIGSLDLPEGYEY